MPGASKKRQQSDRRRGGGAGGSSRDGAETSSASVAPPATAQESEPTTPVQADRPMGYDGASSPPPGSRGTQPRVIEVPGGITALPDPFESLVTDINRRLDLPPAAYNLNNQYALPTALPRRPPQTNTAGKPVTVRVNVYNIAKYPEKTIHQYDVLIGSGVEKRALIRKVWESKPLQKLIGESWIFDGNRLAWALDNKPGELNIVVDLDAEEGRQARPGRENKHRVIIRQTTKVPLAAIGAYLKGTIAFDNSVLQAINFLDHLLRYTPSKNLTAVRQSFFTRGEGGKYDLGGGVEAMKGVFQSIRTYQGGRLGLNVDVSNGSFWQHNHLVYVVSQMTRSRDLTDFMRKIADVQLRPDNPKKSDSAAWKDLKRLKRLGVYPRHRGVKAKSRTYVIESLIKVDAYQYKFQLKNRETGEVETASIYDYFLKRYDITLLHPELPLVQTTKKGVVFPIEVLAVMENQKYPYKLDDQQTSKMIKFAVTRPDQRMKDIQTGINKLNWTGDKMLQAYGLSINPNMIETQARVLPPPVVQFQGSTVAPGTSGRWDLKGPRKFLTVNPEPLKAWGVCVYPGRPATTNIDKASVQNFVREFIKSYQNHGGRVENKTPVLIQAQVDAAKGVEEAWTKTKNAFNMRPQMIVFILSDKNTFHYLRVKKSADCRFGIMTQCVQAAHCQKSAPQYLSNVCMKFNAKLGGSTSRVAGKHPQLGHFSVPSIVIGADVSHPPGMTEQPSMAAMTVSLDKIGVRYAAACETNGRRIEMITPNNVKELAMPLVRNWVEKVNGGGLPQHLYYFRDGVSEGQYQHVLQQELRDIRNGCLTEFPGWVPKFVVVVASKRHHIRFFPKPNDRVGADRNGNPVPGTLVEKDVTHPFENDFYLCSHSAIQGTARPVHYHVLLDEVGLSTNQLHAMIYEQCYAYIRSTTPVSLHPAIYYAHLASNRARHHENVPASTGPRSGPEMKKAAMQLDKSTAEPAPLLPWADVENSGMDKAMWYI